MAVIDRFRLRNTSNNTGIKFHWAESFDDNVTVNNTSLSIPGKSSSGNFVVNIGGFQRNLTVNFVIYDDGSDKSTDGSGKVTLKDQWDHLMDTVLQGIGAGDSQTDVSYEVDIVRNDSVTTYSGGIENITVKGDPGRNGNMVKGSLTLKIGQSFTVSV